jgi:peroxiredoxin Q/BCP
VHGRKLKYRRKPIMSSTAVLEANDKAPAFTLLNEDSQPVSLKDFNGQNVVLFFYPKADTPG